MSTKEKVKQQIDEMDDQIGVLEAKTESAKAEAKDVFYSASESFKEGFTKLKSLFD